MVEDRMEERKTTDQVSRHARGRERAEQGKLEGKMEDVTEGRNDSKKARGRRISKGLGEGKGRTEHGHW